MTQQEVTALKARFKAGGYPTQQDFEALIDAIAASASSSASTPTGSTVIHVNNLLRDNLVSNINTNKGSTPDANPFVATTVADIIAAYERLNSTSLSNVETVIIVNESWDFKYYDGNANSWAHESAFYGVDSSDSATNGGTNVPIYIKTKYANVMPDITDSANSYNVLSENPTEFGDSYSNDGGHDAEYIIDVIPDGNAMMFVKRTPYTDAEGNSNTIDWVPVTRNITITEYELGQMYQNFSGEGGLS